MLRDHIAELADDLARRTDRSIREQCDALGGDSRLLAHYRDDWVLIYPNWYFRNSFEFDEVTGRATMTTTAPILCPKSIADDAEELAEFLATGKIPADTPELRRMASARAAKG